MNIADALEYYSKDKNINWSVGETYDSIVWMSTEFEKPTLEQLNALYNNAMIEKHLKNILDSIILFIDKVAQIKSYGNALSCISYFNSSNLTWKDEAEAFITWRDSIWAYVYQELPKFENGERQLIPADQFIEEFPPMIWPS